MKTRAKNFAFARLDYASFSRKTFYHQKAMKFFLFFVQRLRNSVMFSGLELTFFVTLLTKIVLRCGKIGLKFL